MTLNDFAPGYLQIALKSLSDQTLQDFEICIVTKSDAALYIIEPWARENDIVCDIRVMPGSESRTHRFCEAVLMCTGKWIGILDGDDVLHPGALETVTKCLAHAQHLNFFTTSHAQFTTDPYTWRKVPAEPFAQTCAALATRFRQRHFWGFKNADMYWPQGMLSSPYPIEDIWIFHQLALAGIPVLHIPHILYGWRYWTGQWTQAHKDECRRVVLDATAKMEFKVGVRNAGHMIADNLLAARMTRIMVELEKIKG